MQVSERAVQELSRLAREELARGEFLRIDRAFRCGGPRFQVVIDDRTAPLDSVIRLSSPDGDVEVTVGHALVQLLEGITLDYSEEGFVFGESSPVGC
ncbi:iron-sulfur cluster assembly protein [Alicyclobacillus mali]|uniref:Iron-sulfur cluster assembly protein n=1 Tax=Alicyclobacillus mali (ex Roth et al. 2021) TaxID=1123961 RepID=A0ABS0F745_9BACL|nr:iron-sulfur cluster assembly protein [Alicyclobacillus mali (ex Roth et al. 2021)]MBF8379110.1 iron-sulfur cluster assembly protein [Alicyclobacillus mali (ex Roth et al. 2021)]MCL6488616.1 iron-sulfur cluster assembly protein [Alicyclobacillus mali (ex Roth et al. 2021)]